jgi:hypothetical protein
MQLLAKGVEQTHLRVKVERILDAVDRENRRNTARRGCM